MTEGTSKQNLDNSHTIAHRPLPFFLLPTSQKVQQYLSTPSTMLPHQKGTPSPVPEKCHEVVQNNLRVQTMPHLATAKFNSMLARPQTLSIPYLVSHFLECQNNLQLLRYFLYSRQLYNCAHCLPNYRTRYFNAKLKILPTVIFIKKRTIQALLDFVII